MDNDITALAFLSADIYVNQSEASVQQIVDWVWNALAANYNTGNTMGEAVQTGWSGGGATPAQIWSYADRTLTESAWLSTEEHDKLMSISNGWGGGFSSQAIQSSINNAKREIIEKMEEIPSKIPQVSLENIETQLTEIDSHIELAKTDVIDTIKESETGICSDVIRKSKDLEESNVKTRNLVRQKTEKINKKLDKDEEDEKEGDEILELLKEMKEEQDDKEILEFLDDIEEKDIETLLT